MSSNIETLTMLIGTLHVLARPLCAPLSSAWPLRVSHKCLQVTTTYRVLVPHAATTFCHHHGHHLSYSTSMCLRPGFYFYRCLSALQVARLEESSNAFPLFSVSLSSLLSLFFQLFIFITLLAAVLACSWLCSTSLLCPRSHRSASLPFPSM